MLRKGATSYGDSTKHSASILYLTTPMTIQKGSQQIVESLIRPILGVQTQTW